jgi:hypothetical protein
MARLNATRQTLLGQQVDEMHRLIFAEMGTQIASDQ